MIEGKSVKAFSEANGIHVGDVVETRDVLPVKSVLGSDREVRISVIQEFDQCLLNMRTSGFRGQVVKINLCRGEYVFVVYNGNNRVAVPYLRTEIFKVV